LHHFFSFLPGEHSSLQYKNECSPADELAWKNKEYLPPDDLLDHLGKMNIFQVVTDWESSHSHTIQKTLQQCKI
jgi:hypothetical protein